MTWTPLEFGFADAAVTIALLAVIGGLGWLLFAWLPRKWAEAGQVIDDASADVCLYCRQLALYADCTCSRRCTAMVCMAPAEVRRG